MKQYGGTFTPPAFTPQGSANFTPPAFTPPGREGTHFTSQSSLYPRGLCRSQCVLVLGSLGPSTQGPCYLCFPTPHFPVPKARAKAKGHRQKQKQAGISESKIKQAKAKAGANTSKARGTSKNKSKGAQAKEHTEANMSPIHIRRFRRHTLCTL